MNTQHTVATASTSSPKAHHGQFGAGHKVCHITTVDISLKILLLNQMKWIKESGFQVYGISSAGEHVADLESEGIEHFAVTMTRKLSPIADLISVYKLYRLLKREQFTIVHTHNPKPGLLGQLAAKLAGVPIIINTVHGFYFHDLMKPWVRRFYITMEKIAALCSDRILSQNKDDLQTALDENIASQDKLWHLGNGIDTRQYDPALFTKEQIREKKHELGIAEDAPVVGFVGRLAVRKGFHDLLEAAVLLRKEYPKVKFLIVGEKDVGKTDALDESLSHQYDLGDSMIFMGRRPNSELPLLYSCMSVLVLPSPWEGVPRAVMEATSMAIPAVVTNVKGNRDVVEEGINGHLVPFGDVEQLAEGLAKVINNPEHAHQLGQKGRKRAIELFHEEDVFARIIQHYYEEMEQKGLLHFHQNHSQSAS